jgi:hypothetical protein
MINANRTLPNYANPSTFEYTDEESDGDRPLDANADSSTSVLVSPDDDIEVLALPIRAYNALKRRSNIRTVADLFRLVESGQLWEVRNIGSKSVAEIEDKLSRVRLTEPIQEYEDDSQSQLNMLIAENQVLQARNADLQRHLRQLVMISANAIRRQLAAGLLHQEAIVLGKTIADWLELTSHAEVESVAMAMSTILESSVNICDELEYLFDQAPTRSVEILTSRYGSAIRTLDEIGKGMNLTRERVRQLCVKITQQIEVSAMRARRATVSLEPTGSAWPMRPPLVRIQSALLRARDMGLDISFAAWKDEILSSGSLGRCESPTLHGFDPIEVMLATCRASCEDKRNGLVIPENLSYAIQAAFAGEPDLPARVLHIRATLPPAIRKHISRHAKFTGAVNARWLAEDRGMTLVHAQDILRAVGFRAYLGDWFVSSVCDQEYTIDAHDVFHHALRKMSQYCGPLSAESICGGLRHAVSRTNFPVPPPEVIIYLLEEYGYACSDSLFCWDNPVGETLSEAESVIMGCLIRYGPVVHHAELASEFVRSPLSFAALHPTLAHSPIFEKIDSGLYKLRGAAVTPEQIQRAQAVAETVPLNLSVQYDRRGYIIICATLGVLAIGNGSFVSEQLPNLAGSWKCLVHEQQAGTLQPTPNEFRHLRQALDLLDCQIGDRLMFTFNTWTHTVAVEKVGQ